MVFNLIGWRGCYALLVFNVYYVWTLILQNRLSFLIEAFSKYTALIIDNALA